ncbi:hypothetical protein [Actinoallomurus sp. CA-150999]|uniref:hypothetical protein n=1 Tax=Actinoallomurus sp. CA-150999 TaxID=3239887 RepID=UPI003D949A87
MNNFDMLARTLRRQTISRSTITAVFAAIGAVGVTVAHLEIPVRHGAAVAMLAGLGVVTLLDLPANWIQARYELRIPSWSPRSWSAGRRWYGPHRPVTVVTGTEVQVGIALDWTDSGGEYGAGIWVLVLTWTKDPQATTTAWYPLSQLQAPYRPRLPRRRIRWASMFRCKATGQRLFTSGHRHAHRLGPRYRCRPSLWRLWPALVRETGLPALPRGDER